MGRQDESKVAAGIGYPFQLHKFINYLVKLPAEEKVAGTL